MTVKDAMDIIKDVKEHAEFLYQLSDKERDEHIEDHLEESAGMLIDYAELLEKMKVQGT